MFVCLYFLIVSKILPFKIKVFPAGRGHPLVIEINNVTVGTIVDHERNDPAFPFFEFLWELQNISDRGPTETVKALIVVAYHTDILFPSGEKKDKLFLNIVGILILIDHNVSYLRPYLIQDFRVFIQEIIGFHLY